MAAREWQVADDRASTRPHSGSCDACGLAMAAVAAAVVGVAWLTLWLTLNEKWWMRQGLNL